MPLVASRLPKSAQIAFCLFLATAAALLVPDDSYPLIRRGIFIFCTAALSWAFELIPLFATSLLVVFLSTVFLVPASGSQFEYLTLFSNPIIFLFLGGFVLAAVIHKYHVDERMVASLLKRLGGKPFLVLLGLILATGFLSFWMSNTATTAIMLVTIRPILASVDSKDPFRKALALSIPFAANIGGIGTPIATPPNAIAVSLLAQHGIEIDFLKWMTMAVPLVGVLLALLAVSLFLTYPAKAKTVNMTFEKRNMNRKSWLAIVIALMTIVMWLSAEWHHIPESHIAILSVALFAVSGLITTEDLKRLDWDILVLMWGGLALGRAMEVSGLAKWVVSFSIFNQSGFLQVAIFAILTVVISIFMSNTAAANLILPLAISAGGSHAALLAVMVALASSFDMILPISTPPNAMAFATHEISSFDMLKSGTIIILIAIVLLLLGYPIFIERILLG